MMLGRDPMRTHPEEIRVYRGAARNGVLIAVTREFTRPANTTAYASNDVICNSTTAPLALTLADVVPLDGGSGIISKVRLVTNLATFLIPVRVWFYTVAPTSAADNAAFALDYTGLATRVGYIDLPRLATEGTGSAAACALNAADKLPFICAAADANLYAVLEAKDAGTPASGQKFTLEVVVDLV